VLFFLSIFSTVEIENIARKFGLHINQEETKCLTVERKNSLKKNKIGHLKIKNLKEWKCLNILELYLMKLKKKVKGRVWGFLAPQPVGRLYPCPNEFPSFNSRGAMHHIGMRDLC